MIVATKTVDSLLKGVVARENLVISAMESICKSMQLDPDISAPKKEMYIVSSDDIKNPKLRNEFESAVRMKHPKSLIMYINKNGRQISGITEDMFEAYISKPNRQVMKEKFEALISESESKAQFKISDDFKYPEKYNPQVPSNISQAEIEIALAESESAVTLNFEKQIETVAEPENEEMNLLNRIKKSENWAALTAISQEVNASRVIQEVTEANATFRQSENYVSALSENITAILSNPEYDTTTQLSKIRAILYDKSYHKAKTNSIVEQSVEQIIVAIVDKAKQEVEAKTAEMDEKILLAFKHRGANEAPNVRLSTIIENRAKVLIELTALDLEVKGLSSKCISTINDTVDNVISSSVSSTESPILDSQIKARFGEIVPDNMLTVLDNLFVTGQESSQAFGQMSEAVNSTIRKLYKLLSLYQEESEVLADTIKYLRAKRVEDTVLANTIMKKSSRMFISNGDFDSIALTYMISKHNSRKNNNVLLLDLTGSDVLDMFGVSVMKYSNFMEQDNFNSKFLVVSVTDDAGTSITTDENNQRLSTRLLHYSKHYSMINIMCTPDQTNLINNFMSDVLSITYLVDCYPTTIKTMAKCIASSKVDNTANRLVLVNYISDSAAICRDLGIMERLDMQLTMCNPVPSIRYCSLHNQDPYEVESILNDISSVLKVC